MSLLLVLLAMEVAGGYLLTSLNRYYMANFSQNLTTQGTLLGSFLERYLADPQPNLDLSPLIAQFGSAGGVSTVVVNRAGMVVGTSATLQPQVGMRLSSPLASTALKGRRMSVYSQTPGGVPDLVLAVPVTDGGRVVGAILVTAVLTPVIQTISHVRQILIVATLLSLLLSVVLGLAISRMVALPIRRLMGRVSRMAAGDFAASGGDWPDDEVGDLGRAFDQLSGRLADTLQVIADEKQKLETILFHMKDGLIALDRGGTIVLSNPQAAILLSADTAPGRSIKDLPLPEHLGTERPAILPGPDAKGAQRVLRFETTPVGDTGVRVVVISDVTEEARLERMRQQFVADVGHELRTPLTTIKSYLETVLGEKVLKPNLRQRFVSVALSETDRLVRLVRDLLTLSQADSGRLTIDPRPIDIPTVIEETLLRLGPAIDRKGIQIVTVIPADLPRLWGDGDRIGQVLLNLVSNAVEFSSPGSRVRLLAEPRDGRVMVSVEDWGPGIPKEDLPRIFERFYRVDKARSRELGGTGLGLAIAREIVIAHGGEIGIDSRLGEGTTVTVSLPTVSSERTGLLPSVAGDGGRPRKLPVGH